MMILRVSRVKRKSILNILFAAILIIVATYNPEFYGFHLSNYMVFALGAFCLLYLNKTSLKIKRADLCAFLLFYFIIFVFGIIFFDENSLSIAVKLLLPLLVALICSSLRCPDKAELISHYLLVANICACLTGIVHSYILEDVTYMMRYNDAWITRMTGAFEQPNIFAAFLVITLPSGVWSITTEIKRGVRHVCLIAFLSLNLLCLFQSKSRWSILSLAFAFLVWFLCFSKRYLKRSKKILLVLLLIVCVGLMLVTNDWFLTYIQMAFGKRSSTSIRLESFTSALSIGFNNLMLGSGLGKAQKMVSTSVLDSTYLTVFVETGLLGLTAFLWICVRGTMRIAYLSKASDKSIYAPFLIMCIIMMVEMIAESILYNSLLNIFFGIIWYLAFSASQSSNVLYEEKNRLPT